MASFRLFVVITCLFFAATYCSSFILTAVPSYDEFINEIVSKAEELDIPNPENISEFDNVRRRLVSPDTIGYKVGYRVQECFPENHRYSLDALDGSWEIRIVVSYNKRMAAQGHNLGSLFASIKSSQGEREISRIPGL